MSNIYSTGNRVSLQNFKIWAKKILKWIQYGYNISTFQPSNCPGRKKVIHSVGVVGRVEWRDAGGHPYTGIFRGARHGIARLSSALPADPSSSYSQPTPGMGLKFLRDGRDSANMLAVYSIESQESWNFFKNDFANHIPSPGFFAAPIIMKFATATVHIQQVGISNWGKAGEDGNPEAAPRFPYRLRFHPTGDIAFPDEYRRPINDELMTIPPGSTLYQVFALDKPDELGGKEKMIGELVLTSTLTTSNWGDTGLFFRHQDMVEDLRIHPEWNDATPQYAIWKKSPFRYSPCLV